MGDYGHLRVDIPKKTEILRAMEKGKEYTIDDIIDVLGYSYNSEAEQRYVHVKVTKKMGDLVKQNYCKKIGRKKWDNGGNNPVFHRAGYISVYQRVL